MSKIGRKPIDTHGIIVETKGQEVHYKGKKVSGVYVLPMELKAHYEDNKLKLLPQNNAYDRRVINALWGLHRALLFNKIFGAKKEFEKQVEIVGLGYKVSLAGKKMVFSLGYSHKIELDLPEGVAVAIDKTGKILTFSSIDKDLVGHVCSVVRALRPPEPYKGTGIKLATEKIERKAGKAKAAA